MAKTFDICIRGAGVVGRTLALLLARERLRVLCGDDRMFQSTPAIADGRTYEQDAAAQWDDVSIHARHR